MLPYKNVHRITTTLKVGCGIPIDRETVVSLNYLYSSCCSHLGSLLLVLLSSLLYECQILHLLRAVISTPAVKQFDFSPQLVHQTSIPPLPSLQNRMQLKIMGK